MVGMLLLSLAVGAADEAGWGDEPDSVDGFQRVTEAALLADAGLRGRRVYLDGKFGGATRERVLLRASGVALVDLGRPFDPARLASLQRDSNVRVFGVVTAAGAQPAIGVDRIEVQPDDGQRFRALRARLEAWDAKGLYALSERLRRRFERYGGGHLLEWARATAREAVEADLAALRDQPAGLYDLAERAERLAGGLQPLAHSAGPRPSDLRGPVEPSQSQASEAARPAALVRRILEAALAAEKRGLGEGDAAGRFALAEKWERLLPGRTAEPAALRHEGLRIEERLAPAADPEACFALARRYADLVGDQGRARDLTRRGLALEAARLAPHDYAGRYRLSRKVADLVEDAPWSQRLLAEGAAVERTQLAGRAPAAYFQLAERYAADLGDAAAAEVLVRQALAVQEERLDPRDLNGHLDLALEYLARLGDRQAAIDRLRACLALVPDEPRVRARLADLGMVEVDGRWYEPSAVQSDPKLAWEAAIEQAVAAGRIEVGMEPRHVRRAWGEPVRRDAALTRNATTVQWTYAGVRPTRVLFRNGRVVGWSR